VSVSSVLCFDGVPRSQALDEEPCHLGKHSVLSLPPLLERTYRLRILNTIEGH
jgi:hypothetical protein